MVGAKVPPLEAGRAGFERLPRARARLGQLQTAAAARREFRALVDALRGTGRQNAAKALRGQTARIRYFLKNAHARRLVPAPGRGAAARWALSLEVGEGSGCCLRSGLCAPREPA